MEMLFISALSWEGQAAFNMRDTYSDWAIKREGGVWTAESKKIIIQAGNIQKQIRPSQDDYSQTFSNQQISYLKYWVHSTWSLFKHRSAHEEQRWQPVTR